MFCPSLEDVTQAVLSLLPRGRAWQTNDGLPRPGFEGGFQDDAFQEDAFQTDHAEISILWRYWRAFSDLVWSTIISDACAYREELWCATHVKTHDGWMKEYGLPDECDPFPDLCTKVSAIGGTRCEYYQEIAARLGWSISCETRFSKCGHTMRARTMGCFRVGSSQNPNKATLFIRVILDESPAMTSPRWTPPLMKRLRTGMRFHCAPNLSPLKCLLTRVIHAEVLTIYEVA